MRRWGIYIHEYPMKLNARNWLHLPASWLFIYFKKWLHLLAVEAIQTTKIF